MIDKWEIDNFEAHFCWKYKLNENENWIIYFFTKKITIKYLKKMPSFLTWESVFKLFSTLPNETFRKRILKSDSHLLKKLCYWLDWKPFKKGEKCFLFHLKSSFRCKDISVFVTTFWSCRENSKGYKGLK